MAGKQKKRPSVLCNVERYDPKYMLWTKVADLPKRCYSPGVIRYKKRALQLSNCTIFKLQRKAARNRRCLNGRQQNKGIIWRNSE